jgi:hypothetical protein
MMEYYSPIKNWDTLICSNMDETWGLYVKKNKPDTEIQTPHIFTHLWKPIGQFLRTK